MSNRTRVYSKWKYPLSRNRADTRSSKSVSSVKQTLPATGKYKDETNWKLDKVVWLLHEVLRYNEKTLALLEQDTVSDEFDVEDPSSELDGETNQSSRKKLQKFPEDIKSI